MEFDTNFGVFYFVYIVFKMKIFYNFNYTFLLIILYKEFNAVAIFL